jgi:hypothetical protein
MSKVVEIEFNETVFVSSGVRIPKGMKLKVKTSNDFPGQWEVKEELTKTGFWKSEYKCGLDGTYSVVRPNSSINQGKSEKTNLPFIRRVLYYTIGLIIPFVFAKPIINFLQSFFSFDGILWKKGEKNNASIIDDIPRFKRAVFGIIMPWWLLKMIFGKK